MTRYTLRQRLLGLVEDFDINDENGRPVYNVDNKWFSLRETFVLGDMQGQEVATIQAKLLDIRATMNISRGGKPLATVRKALLTLLGERFDVELAAGGELEVQGDIFDHEYSILREGAPVAQISKRWLALSDTYAVEIALGEDDGLILAVVVALDELSHGNEDA